MGPCNCSSAESKKLMKELYTICEDVHCTHRPSEFTSIALWSFVLCVHAAK
jgi:hypothetical protein